MRYLFEHLLNLDQGGSEFWRFLLFKFPYIFNERVVCPKVRTMTVFDVSFCVCLSSALCQEERTRQGDESLLQKALEESKREMEAKAGGV